MRFVLDVETIVIWKKGWYFSKYSFSSDLAFLSVCDITKVLTSKSIDCMKKHLKWCFGTTSPFLDNYLIKTLAKKKHLKTLYRKTLLTHHQNIHKLLIEMYRAFSSLSKVVLVSYLIEEMSTTSVNDIVTIRKAVAKGWNSLLHYRSVIWNSLANIQALEFFKQKVKIWKPTTCPCNICNDYVDGVGFVSYTVS